MNFSIVRKSALAASIALALSAHSQAKPDDSIALESTLDKASYGIGFIFAQNLSNQTQGIELNDAALIKGIQDALGGAESQISEEETQEAMMEIQKAMMEKQQQQLKETLEASHAEGTAFLEENSKKEGVKTTDSGLQYKVLTSGEGKDKPNLESTVKVHYHGTLIDGTVFDSSVDRGEPVEFPLNSVITGWSEGVQLMSPGDKYRFFIPSDLGYGDRQITPKIPPGSTLIFEVELLEIVEQQPESDEAPSEE